MLSSNYNVKGLTLNKPQWRSWFTHARRKVNVWSRGTGKTVQKALKTHTLAHNLPRGVIAIVGRTLDQMMTNTLPGVMSALEDWGYTEWDGKRGDYVVGKRPPDHWPKPYAKRLKYDKCISWNTGTALVLVSQERKGSGRGYSFDAILADEALTLKPEHLQQEVIAANRGNNHKFPDNPYHHCEEYWTSKPYVGMGAWINNQADYYQEEFGIDIISKNNAAANLMLQFIDSNNRQEQNELWREISAFLMENPYRVYQPSNPNDPSVYYNEAVVLDNINILGWSYIKQLRQSMTDFMFKVEVLNMTVNAAENSFYHVSEDLKYDPPSFYESHGIHLLNHTQVTPYQMDTDVVRTEPLDIACDANYGICTMAVGQLVENDFRLLNGIFVKKEKDGKLIRDLAKRFCEYYKEHPKKHVRFFYDHTFSYIDAGRPKSFALMIIEVLKEHGWIVEERHIGQQPRHHSRYETVNQYLMGQQPISISFNRLRSNDLYLSLESTSVRIVGNEFKKDKRPEASTTVKQEHTTHFSDAFDTLVIGRLVQHPTAYATTNDDVGTLTQL